MAYPTPYAVPPAPTPQEQHMVQELSMPIFQARGWLKFLGVLSIISGVGTALSIVGIIFAWLPIWMGVLMFQAGSSIEFRRPVWRQVRFPALVGRPEDLLHAAGNPDPAGDRADFVDPVHFICSAAAWPDPDSVESDHQ